MNYIDRNSMERLLDILLFVWSADIAFKTTLQLDCQDFRKTYTFMVLNVSGWRFNESTIKSLLTEVCVVRSSWSEHFVCRIRRSQRFLRYPFVDKYAEYIIQQVLMQVPSNAMLNYCGRPSWYIGFWVIAWGLVSLLTSQVKNYGSIVACRFILGVVEAPFFCGVIFYLSKWYTKQELAFRMAIFYSASLLSGAFGNLIAAGILNGLAGEKGLAAWQVCWRLGARPA